MPMEMCMRGIGRKIKRKDSECIQGQMEIGMLGNGKMINNTVKGKKPGEMDPNIMAIIGMDLKRVKGN